MTQFKIREAKRKGTHLRMAIIGPAGSGKSYTALKIAKGLTRNGRIAAIDTEHQSLDKYADILAPLSFSKIDLDTFSPETYADAIEFVFNEGFDTLSIDSLSHGWMGKDGALEQVDRAARRSQSGNTFTAWKDVTPMQNRLTEAIIQAKGHVISTMRAKTEYQIVENDKGKKEPKKIGLGPVQRADVEFDYDVVGEMDMDHNLIITKTRIEFLDGMVVKRPDEQLGKQILAWLDGNEPEAPTDSHLLTEIATIMKRKNLNFSHLQAAGFQNPRELSGEDLMKVNAWVKEQ